MRFRRAAAALISAVLTARSAHAGAVESDCRTPLAFPTARTNFVVMPFGYSPLGISADSLRPNTRAFALVQQIHALRTLAPFGSVGSVQIGLSVDSPECDPDIVWAKLMGQAPGAQDRVAPGHGLVLMWGVLYATNDELLLQSSIRFGMRARPDTFGVALDGATFHVEPSANVLTFPPRSIDDGDLDRLFAGYDRSLRLHTAPDDSAPLMQVRGLGSGRSLTYQIDAFDREWMKVRFFPTGQSGWIRAAWGEEGERLDDHFPEMTFVVLVTAYLQDAAEPADSRRAAFLLSTAENAWTRFVKQSGESMDPTVQAVGEQILGIMRMHHAAKSDTASFGRAARSFEVAANLLPASGSAQSNAAVARLRRDVAIARYPLAPRDLQRQFQRAIAVDPGTGRSIQNAQAYFDYVQHAQAPSTLPAADALKPEEIDAGLRNLARVRAVQSRSISPGTFHVDPPAPRMQLQSIPVERIMDMTGVERPVAERLRRVRSNADLQKLIRDGSLSNRQVRVLRDSVDLEALRPRQ